MRFSTKAIHVGQEADPATGATVLPIHQSSTFTQRGIGRHLGYEYSRTCNPTRAALEKCVASLENAEFALAFASGSAATAAALSTLRPGDHVVAAADLYGGTYRYLERVLRPNGISITYVESGGALVLEQAFTPATRFAWMETPTNPRLDVFDIAAWATVARARGAMLVVDNTFATPYLQRPLALGAHAVVHSTTKYMGGHSDCVGGAFATSDADYYERVKFYQNSAGAVPGPFDSWLTLRGLKTLALRMERHSANAMEVARFLEGHPKVALVRYPGLAGHPGHELAAAQMSGRFGGMVSFTLSGGRDEADRFCSALEVFSFAESLGGVESLACHPATMTHGSIPAEERERRGITEGTIRLSVGIEDIEDLVHDLDRALSRV